MLIFVVQTHTHRKRNKKHLKNYVASLTSPLSAYPTIVWNASILNLLNLFFIWWCQYYLTKSLTQKLSFVHTFFRDWLLSKKCWYMYLCFVNVNPAIQVRNLLASKREIPWMSRFYSRFYAQVKMTLVTSPHKVIAAFKARWLFQAINLEILCKDLGQFPIQSAQILTAGG